MLQLICVLHALKPDVYWENFFSQLQLVLQLVYISGMFGFKISAICFTAIFDLSGICKAFRFRN